MYERGALALRAGSEDGYRQLENYVSDETGFGIKNPEIRNGFIDMI